MAKYIANGVTGLVIIAPALLAAALLSGMLVPAP
jgi:hypothetical protein